jgi:hypothetical protein
MRRTDNPTEDLQMTEISAIIQLVKLFHGGKVIKIIFRTLGGSSFDSEDRRVKISSLK